MIATADYAWRDEGSYKHGTHYAYRYKQCRCIPCLDFRAMRMREWRARRKAAGRPVRRGT